MKTERRPAEVMYLFYVNEHRLVLGRAGPHSRMREDAIRTWNAGKRRMRQENIYGVPKLEVVMIQTASKVGFLDYYGTFKSLSQIKWGL